MLQDRTILQNKDWENCYVGIPYKYSGRGRDGLDCWGLVRLVHKDQFGIDLPSFTEVDTKDKQSEVISIAKEYWTPVAVEQAGDVVVFNILGESTHVGIITKPGYFLHAYENQDVRVERLDSVKWKKRIEGIYRYSKDTGANLVGLSHPLRTKRIDAVVQAGKTLAEIHQELKEKEASELSSTAVIYVDSKLIPQSEWDTYVVQNAQRIEYRAVMQGGKSGSFLKMAAMVALAVAATWVVTTYGTAAMVTAKGTLTALGYATTIGINMAGAMLINSIFPTRPPKANTYSNETGKASWFLQGGSNQSNKYGAIPVVLGRMRYTPPTAIETYYEAQDTTSYLRTVLCWGYGPLAVSDIRIGDESLDNYYNVEIETLSGYSTDNRTRFDTLYGKDVEQQQVGVALNNNKAVVDTAVRTSNVVTVNTKTSEEPHGFLIGQHIELYDNSTLKASGEILTVSEYAFTFNSAGTNGSITCSTAVATSWVVRALDEEVDELTLSFEYSQGLYKTDATTGNKSSLSSSLSVAYRQIGSSNWLNANTTISAFSTNLSPVPDLYAEGLGHTGPVQMYQWVYLLIDKDGNVFTRVGSASSNYNATISTEVIYLSKSTYALSTNYNVQPNTYPEDIILAKILVSRDYVVSIQTVYSGFTVNSAGLSVSVNGSTINRTTGDVFLSKKALSPFVNTVKYNVPRGKYEVRVRNTKYNSGDYNADSVTFGALTGYRNTKPIAFDKPLAMSAIRIRATNQINGNVDGFTGTVQSICKDYDYTTDTWVDRATNNPASLFRYVLQHPANSKALADSAIDLVTLKDWHNTCRLNGFTYNSVLTEQQSLTEVLKDIAAAGRASPSRIDGKYTVIQDKPRTTITQHFTPHNSWGFEGSKTLPKLPHAFRVSFINEEKGFQPDEYIVYNDGYNANNATLFEGMSLPGVTKPALVYKHARFHLAQIKLRPETYVINADLEHLVCNRGDLVKVVHDVPMFGIASCRVGNKLSSTQLQLDEDLPMQAGKQYTIRIRNDDGSSIVRTVQAKSSDGYYNTIDLTSPLGVNEGLANNLVLFGEINQESVDLIVLGIETNANLTARLTLVDYSPEVYDSDTETIPEFNSKVTLPAGLLSTYINSIPVINVETGDSAITVISPNVFQYGLRVNWTASNSTSQYEYVEVQLDWAGDNTQDWLISQKVPINNGSVLFTDVTLGDEYVVRARFVNSKGQTGRWTEEVTATVIGKESPPNDVTGFSLVDKIFSWNNLTAPDIAGYKIRYSYNALPTWESSADLPDSLISASPYHSVSLPEGDVTFLIKAVDTLGNESLNATSISKTIVLGSIKNILEFYDYEANSFPGSIIGGSLSATNLVADMNAVMYKNDNLQFYTFDSNQFYVNNYSDIEWISAGYTPQNVKVGSNIRLETEFSGNNPLIYYRLTGPNKFFNPIAASSFYNSEVSTSFYEQIGDWKLWTGSAPAANTEYQFKFVDINGEVQGKLDKFKVFVDSPDIFYTVDDLNISSTGTRVSEVAGMFSGINNIQVTLQSNTADSVIVADKDISLGPLIYTKLNGTNTNSVVDILITAY